MCGIVGAVSGADGKTLVPTVERLTELLYHRGPDDRGVAAQGAACFGHTRLAIIGTDRDEAIQPVAKHGCLLTFNGEIYNFKDLAERLRGQGVTCTGTSDTEVLFLCLLEWGVAATLKAIDGMFAFAFHDGQSRTTYLARDPIGEKPLYWWRGQGQLWFASEIKALLATGDRAPAPNLARIDEFLYTAKVAGTATLFEGINELEPGTFMELRDGGQPILHTYWRLETVEPKLGEGRVRGERDAFLSMLRYAVASRRVSDVPVGVLLSGGIDSNALTELLLAANPDDSLDLFFADNAGPEVSERTDVELFVAEARRRYPAADLRFRPALVDFDDYHEKFRRLTWYYDEPIQFSNSPLLGGLCRWAREAGIKVLFSGEGSDELLYGYDRFRRTREQLEGEHDRHAILSALYFGGGQHTVDLVRRLAAEVGEGAEASEAWRWLEAHVGRMPLDTLQLIFSQKYRMQMLLQRQDRIGMAESIEIRVPFLAPRFLSWVNRLPLSAKRDPVDGTTKRILRDVMRTRLPARILEKAKDGFPTDMNIWIRTGAMEGLVRAMVGDPNGFSQSYLDGRLARTIVADHFSGAARRDVLVWNLFSLETWHRVFWEGTPTGAPATPEAAATVH